MSKVCIVDYKGGNIFSVQNTVSSLGAEPYLSSDAKEVAQADKIIFPGVGSFSSAMQHLKELDLIKVLQDKAVSGTPFLGVCVGMQVLFSEGSESSNGNSPGLGIFSGIIEKFTNKDIKIPHMGWNQIKLDNKNNPLYKNVKDGSNFYFVHSYMAKLKDTESITANKQKYPDLDIISCDYGDGFISSIWNGEKLFACQFHPEKSGPNGLRVIENFLKL